MPRSKMDTDRPSPISPCRLVCVGFRGVESVAICIQRFNGAISSFREVRYSLVAYWILGGSFVSFVQWQSHFLQRRNTRYGRVVSSYPTGTYTPQDMPSFAWRSHPTLAEDCFLLEEEYKLFLG